MRRKSAAYLVLFHFGFGLRVLRGMYRFQYDVWSIHRIFFQSANVFSTRNVRPFPCRFGSSQVHRRVRFSIWTRYINYYQIILGFFLAINSDFTFSILLDCIKILPSFSI